MIHSRCHEKRKKQQLKYCCHPHEPILVSVVICQLDRRSQGVPSGAANSKIALCHREKVNGAKVEDNLPLLLKEAKQGWEGQEGQHVVVEENKLWQVDIQRLTEKELHCKDKRATAEGGTKPFGEPYLCPRCHHSWSFSHSVSLFLHALTAFVEERRQRTEPWTQKPVNTLFLFPLPSLFQPFLPVASLHHQLCAIMPKAACR